MSLKTAIALAATLLAAVIGPGRAIADDPPQEDAKPGAEAPAATEEPAPLSDRPEEEKALRAALRSYIEAYNAGAPDDLAALVTEDARLEDADGAITQGREAIRAEFAESFADGPPGTLEGQLDALRFFSPDVARAEGSFRITASASEAGDDDAEPLQRGRFSVMAVREDGSWKIAEIRDLPDPDAPDDAPTPYDRLQELEWMVGDWVDETDNAKVTSSVRWAENRSFLVRTFTVEVAGEPASSGTMYLGWDPRAEQIKSWVFDSDGDVGEGYWTRVSPNQWLVKAQGIHHDGQLVSATQLHTLVNKDAVKSSSFDRIIGGQPAPDIDEIIMVRRPPAPDAGEGAEPQPGGDSPR